MAYFFTLTRYYLTERIEVQMMEYVIFPQAFEADLILYVEANSQLKNVVAR